MARVIYVDRFTSLDDIKGKDRGNMILVLQTIMQNGGRFSVFDANSDAMARTLQSICHSDWVKIKDTEYPWTVLELTDAGRAALTPADLSPAERKTEAQ